MQNMELEIGDLEHFDWLISIKVFPSCGLVSTKWNMSWYHVSFIGMQGRIILIFFEPENAFIFTCYRVR